MLYSGSFLTRASGSLGTITASHNRGGQYLRERTIPTDPGTDLQYAMRNFFGEASQGYSDALSDAQRAGWRAYASSSPQINPLGDSHVMTAQQAYIRTNSLRLLAGKVKISNPPTLSGFPELPVIVAVTATAGSGGGSAAIEVEFESAPADGDYYVFQGEPQPAARAWFRGPWNFLGTTNTDTLGPQTGPFDQNGPQKVWVYARRIDAIGRTTNRIQFGPVTVTAP